MKPEKKKYEDEEDVIEGDFYYDFVREYYTDAPIEDL